MKETRDITIKRLQMRSMRRGIKEMDLILQSYFEKAAPQMDDAALNLYDRLLHENDQDLYQWVTGQVSAPSDFTNMVSEISQTFQK